MTKEIIHIHIGQAGCNIGDKLWKQYAYEYGIEQDGSSINQSDESFNMLFSETSDNKAIARSLFIDSGEPEAIQNIKNENHNSSMHQSFVLGKECTGNSYGRGYDTSFDEMRDELEDTIRKIMEQCDSPQGIIVVNSFSGGMSGLATQLLYKLKDDYKYLSSVSAGVYPSDYAKFRTTCIVEPINYMHSVNLLDEISDCVKLMYENQAIADICKKLGMQEPTFDDLNRLIAYSLSTFTVPIRYCKVPMNSYCQFLRSGTNGFLQYSMAPLHSSEKTYEPLPVYNLTKSLFHSQNTFSSYKSRNGRTSMCYLLYQGDFTPLEVRESIESLKLNRYDLINRNTKLACSMRRTIPKIHSNSGLASTDRCVSMFQQSTAMKHSVHKTAQQFDAIDSKRGFYSFYAGHGIGKDYYGEARRLEANITKHCEEFENSCGPSSDCRYE
jgi:tubulin alpha